MPPKSKFTREQITAAALEIASQQDISCVTARAVGKKLNSSARPIFTVFKNMEEVTGEVKKAAREMYNEYVKEGLKEEIHFKGVGKAYIKFAVEQPKLFRLLFMSETDRSDAISVLPVIDDNYDNILSSITEQYGLPAKDALSLYSHLWVYTHGIASLCATKTVKFSEEEISGMLTEVFVSILIKKKSEINERNKADDKS